MGHIVRFHQHLRFPKEHHAGALAALNTYYKKKYDYLFELIVKEGLFELYLFEEELSATTDGTIVCDMWHEGKWNPSDRGFLQTIAPYVEDTEITVYSENTMWQWVIQGGRFKQRHIVYETDDEYKEQSSKVTNKRSRTE
jgi:hypothetical protein